MKMHAYFREKMVNSIYKSGEYALFVPEWAKNRGFKAEDIDQPNITIEGNFYLANNSNYRSLN
jgi:hypothetical protein